MQWVDLLHDCFSFRKLVVCVISTQDALVSGRVYIYIYGCVLWGCQTNETVWWVLWQYDVSCCWWIGKDYLMYLFQWVRFKQFGDHLLTYHRQIGLLHFAVKGIPLSINYNGLVLAWHTFTECINRYYISIHQGSMWLIIVSLLSLIINIISKNWILHNDTVSVLSRIPQSQEAV